MLPTHRPSEEIPTSSMADIAFLLVVFFMLTLTFAASKGLDYAPAQDDDPALEIDPVEAVLVEVERGGVLLVDRRPMSAEQVFGYLAPRLEANPTKPVILRPKASATYGDFAGAFDLLRLVGRDLGLENGIQIAIPTDREIEQHWPVDG